ncbi:hypothetical protein SEA_DANIELLEIGNACE_79 [Arthrobacter phage DanielleIgnace]|nr:hypothetical protein SEA_DANIELLEIGNACE_79 [Arthrobacter phage DanielleIgnace]
MNLLGGEDPIDEIVAELRKQPGWPADDVKDRQFVADLMKKYPQINLSEEAFKWRAWMMDHNQKKEVKPRARFLRWIGNATAFGRQPEARSQNRRNSSKTAPARAEQFGTQSSQELSGW